MPALRELQESFCDALLSGDNTALDARIRADGLGPARRLGIYRNTVFSNLRAALRDIFPVVERVVGADFFTYCADDYIRRHPSPAGDLNRYGASFGDFLAGFTPAASLPYLPDVARLEWRVHHVYHAAEHAALDIARLAAIVPECYETLRFTLHPASTLFASQFPVQRIWQVNQPDCTETPDVNLDSGDVKLLIERRAQRVVIQVLRCSDWALLSQLANGTDFATACVSALSAEADYDLDSAMQRFIAQSTLVDFALP